MEIWLSNGNNDKLLIPVNPESIGEDYSRNFEDIVLANGDEKTVISGKNLKTYTLQSFFPKQYAPYSSYRSAAPMTIVKRIQKWMDSETPLLFQVTTTNINKKVTIRSFNWEEQGGAVGDIDYTLELKEYEPITYSKVKIVSTKPQTTTKRPTPPKKSQTYVVKKGDCLWKIAKRYYGAGSEWKRIYNKNKSVIGKNPNLIYPGQKLVIP